ncbi:MAG: AAA family ATPase [Candidatus Thorarchaeota archaeon]
MRLSKVFIDNYRCFVEFEERLESFTAIVGRNNSGKTSLVHALELLLHPGRDQTVPISRDDFRQQDREIVIEAVFDDLDETDTQAFFALEGSPGAREVGVRLEARWEEGEIVAERYITRPDKEGEERKVRRYTSRYGQFLAFSYVSPYRQPEQAVRLARGSDYRAIVSTYAGDYVQPIETLLGDIKMLYHQIQTEMSQRGGLNAGEYDKANDVLDRVLSFVSSSPAVDPDAELADNFSSLISELCDEWEDAASHCLQILERAVENGDSSITCELRESYSVLMKRVLKLLQRCEVQAALLELRNSIMDSDDFTRMQASLSDVLNLLLPEMPPSLQPFPIQDDRLLSDVLVQLGDTDLLHCGSGYQSAFSIGLRIARVLGEVSRGVKPRLLVVAIEEPEAHLHPHKQRHLVSALQQLQQQMLERHGLRIQILITTHSSNILSGLSFEQVVILRTKAGVTQATKLERETFLEDWLDEMGVSGTDRRIRVKKLMRRWLRSFFHQFSETLFARFTLIVEGYSEMGAFPVWAKHLPLPNDLDQLGISLVVGGGAELSYAARLLESLGVDYLLVCDRGDDHDLSGLDPSRVKETTLADFEEEILAVLPLERVLKAVEATLTDRELDGLYKHLTSPVGVPGLSTAGTWDDVVQFVGNDQLSAEDLMKLKSICRDYEVSRHQKRGLLKGADVGALLAEEADTVSQIPPAYWDALQTAQRVAREIMDYE